MTGTFVNAAGIIVGGVIGIATARQPSLATQKVWKLFLGLGTLFIGLRICWLSIHGPFSNGAKQVVIAVIALIVGHLLGRALNLQRFSNYLGRQATQRMPMTSKEALPRFNDAFLAGTILALLDRDRAMTHPQFRGKLEAVGFGVFIPFFFVTSGMELDLRALFGGGGSALLIPVFLLALLLARGLPAWLYRARIGTRGAVAAGLLQATSLPFIVAAAEIGRELGALDPATGAAFVVAGLLSVMLFPLLALTFLRAAGSPRPRRAP